VSQADFVNRGQALVTSGQYQEAVKVCRLGLLGRPTTVEGRVVLGQALLALKRYDEVLAEMRVALDLDHASVPALLLKAEALVRKGQRVAALEVLDEVRAIAPKDLKLARLATEAKAAAPLSSSQRTVGFVGNAPARSLETTVRYPTHAGDDDNDDPHSIAQTRQTPRATPRAAQVSGLPRRAAAPKGGAGVEARPSPCGRTRRRSSCRAQT
jgi:tetratricopeptide (TPR) repeat protein